MISFPNIAVTFIVHLLSSTISFYLNISFYLLLTMYLYKFIFSGYTKRFRVSDIVCENSYQDKSGAQIREMFSGRTDGKSYEEWMEAFWKRKYESDFSREMNRSNLSVVDQHIYATGKGKHQAYDSEYQCSFSYGTVEIAGKDNELTLDEIIQKAHISIHRNPDNKGLHPAAHSESSPYIP